jgi:hypothetical protein
MTVTTFEGIPPSRGVLSNANILCKRADACVSNPALGSQQDRSGTGTALPRQGVLIVRRGCYTDGERTAIGYIAPSDAGLNSR